MADVGHAAKRPDITVAAVTLSDSVFESLRSEIIRGGLAPGERLVEASLAEWLGVSRTPLREALHRLAMEGWVTRLRAGGYTVATLTRDETAHQFEVRAVLEGLLAREFARSRTPEDAKQLAEWTEELAGFAAAGDAAGVKRCGQQIHGLIFERSGNAVARGILQSLSERVERARNQTVSLPGRLGEAAEGHRQIEQAITAGEPDEAERAMRAHILDGGERLLAAMDADGRADALRPPSR